MADALATFFALAFMLLFLVGALFLFVGGVALGVPFYALIGGVMTLLSALGMFATSQLA